ncbi:HEPN domain-containing protein [Nitrolancea hollandica]|uniref:HEPN domain-containing protein n=1 Tax=Nitrolancea hollandica TaxID=1206749 RepID=UPI0012670DBF|nr:HEPN domain-containing protein [Nitrolancea hollandica]
MNDDFIDLVLCCPGCTGPNAVTASSCQQGFDQQRRFLPFQHTVALESWIGLEASKLSSNVPRWKAQSGTLHRFVVFPYLKTSAPVTIRGITFRGIDDVDGLSEDAKAILQEVTSMFYLRNDQRILKMTYVHYQDIPIDNQVARMAQQIDQAQTLITWLYTNPIGPFGSRRFSYEHSTFYVFERWEQIPRGELYGDDHEYGLVTEPASDGSEQLADIPGYMVSQNFESQHFLIGINGRIYPPHPGFWIDKSQDLVSDIATTGNSSRDWAWKAFLSDSNDYLEEFESRILRALKWYGRSTALSVMEEEQLVDLSIALESLMGLPQREKVTERFKETVMVLLGAIPNLDTWAQQFYDARSAVVHEGRAMQLLFIPDKTNKKSNAARSGESQALLPLSSYGRQVFSLCASTMLTGWRTTRDERLHHFLVSTHTRLTRICTALNDPKKNADGRLTEAASEIEALDLQYWLVEDLADVKTLLAISRLLLENFLQGSLTVTNNLQQIAQPVVQPSPTDGVEDQVRTLREVSNYLAIVEDSQAKQGVWETKHLPVLKKFVVFANYSFAFFRPQSDSSVIT